jgi:hypothetical protein
MSSFTATLTNPITLEERARRARLDASGNLRKMGIDFHNYHILALFLRGTENFAIQHDMTEEDIKKLELLSGPYAVTILKMVLIRNGVTELPKREHDKPYKIN